MTVKQRGKSFLGLSLLVLLCSCQAAPDHGSTGEARDALDWITLSVDLLNFVVVVILLVWSYCDRRSTARSQATTFWIQSLILEPKREVLEKFFEEVLEMVKSMNEPMTPPPQTSIPAFKRKLHALREELVEPLTTVSRHFLPLEMSLNDLEDAVTDFLETDKSLLSEFVVADFEMSIRRLRRDFFSQLLESQASATKLDMTPSARK